MGTDQFGLRLVALLFHGFQSCCEVLADSLLPGLALLLLFCLLPAEFDPSLNVPNEGWVASLLESRGVGSSLFGDIILTHWRTLGQNLGGVRFEPLEGQPETLFRGFS
ncbi:hypothetical protein WI84_24395 [Burkholderia ubonensis]|nr:hypothetical protein WI84_24395 [Burkholderia ubonensis]KVT96543.1 hypothetical protein WK60_08380 [Burkholderia ubonensis]KWN73765.1 hypothetical protein WM23_28480 [Burkholderia ubonensis]ONB63532.1 hypothetical protein AQ902_22040 [Burkholderia pseudomallei]ONC04159.1 hypothetical protein AQ909_03260 [Burkholderia pseudomallei]